MEEDETKGFNDMHYDFKTDYIAKEIKKRKTKSVLLQLPEGLKVYSKKIMDELSGKTKADIYLSGDVCYGACDILTLPECDLTIHFGHSKMVPNEKVIYIETFSNLNGLDVVKKFVESLEGKRIGLVSTIQHSHELKKIKNFLERKGKKVFIGDKGKSCAYPGQILGCDFTAAVSIQDKVDEFLYIGSGRFHPLGVAYYTGKKVIKADPYIKMAEEVKALWEKDSYIRIERAENARTFGIIVGTKPGQMTLKRGKVLKKRLDKKGKKAYIILMDEITPEKVDYLPYDAFVITACPRIVFDDWRNYKKPILLPEEVNVSQLPED
jgi:2-(3-amino-3-carboxypropyl)histidine synthase